MSFLKTVRSWIANSISAHETNNFYIAQVHNRSFFEHGRVLKVLWSEPMGQTPTFSHKSKWRHNNVHTKIRRFVVIRKGKDSSICLPITTYGGRGMKKPGIRLDEHVAIFSGDRPESMKYWKHPIRVKTAYKDKIERESVINIAKTYTIEHNVKVVDVGKVDSDDLERLDKYFVDFITGASSNDYE